MAKAKEMTTNEFDSLIAMMEGKKVQVSIGNIREIRKNIQIVLRSKRGMEALKVLLR